MLSLIALKPIDSSKVSTGPDNNGITLCLDSWRVEAGRENPARTSLESFAESVPSFEQLKEIADQLAVCYVGSGDNDIFEEHLRPISNWDQQKENIEWMHQYFLLYEELTWAMNAGDIGLVETVFPPWIYLFKATGKHKYASQMIKFLANVHFVYPKRLW